jgi:hypothetical protein
LSTKDAPFFFKCFQFLFAFLSFVSHDGDEIITDVVACFTESKVNVFFDFDVIFIFYIYISTRLNCAVIGQNCDSGLLLVRIATLRSYWSDISTNHKAEREKFKAPRLSILKYGRNLKEFVCLAPFYSFKTL